MWCGRRPWTHVGPWQLAAATTDTNRNITGKKKHPAPWLCQLEKHRQTLVRCVWERPQLLGLKMHSGEGITFQWGMGAPEGLQPLGTCTGARNTPEGLWPWVTLQPVKTSGPESGDKGGQVFTSVCMCKCLCLFFPQHLIWWPEVCLTVD